MGGSDQKDIMELVDLHWDFENVGKLNRQNKEEHPR